MIVQVGHPVSEMKPVQSKGESLRPFGLCVGEYTVGGGEMHESESIRRLRAEAHDTVDMFAYRKRELERRVVAAFLRCLGVDFSPDALVTPERDPPDVIFRDARFEVMTAFDEGRRMHADW